MVEKSVKSSSKAAALEILSQVLASRQSGRYQKLPANKGASTHQRAEDDSSEGFSDIDDTEVVGYLNNKEEFLLKKIAWEAMNMEYLKGRKKKHPTDKMKTAPTKKTIRTTTARAAETENKKRLSSKINYDAMEKLFESEEIPKRAKLDSQVGAQDNNGDSQWKHGRVPSEPLSSKEGIDRRESQSTGELGNENYYNEDMYGDEEYYGPLDLENEDEGDGYGYNDSFDDKGF